MILRFYSISKGWGALVALVWFLAWALPAGAQTSAPFGNEWINYSQPYYKIQVAQEGIYRLTPDYLAAAGITAVDPRKFQLFRRGKEVAIHVPGEGDGVFNPGDYIEFYGERNDGKLDVELYRNPEHKIHDYYSLYTDTAAYFLTWGAANGKRMAVQTSTPGGMSPETYLFQTRLHVYTDVFIHGYRIVDSKSPWMDLGEGFLSDGFTYPNDFVLSGISSVEPTGFKPLFEIAVSGGYLGGHELDIFIVPPSGTARLVGNVKYRDYEFRIFKTPIEFSDIHGNGDLKVRLVPKGPAPDWYTVSYLKLDFPQKPNLQNKGLSAKTLPDKAAPAYFLFDNPVANAVAWDITDHAGVIKITGQEVGGKKGFVLPAADGGQRAFFIDDQSNFLPPPRPAILVRFRQIQPANHNYLIVTHPKLRAPFGNYANPPQDYAAYRASVAGGGYDTLVVEAPHIYDQFFYGDKSSAAIQRFMRFMMASGSPQHLLLLGKGLDLMHRNAFFRKNPYTATEQDLVPPGGSPGSDLVFSADIRAERFTPKVATGRVAAFTSKDVVSYLEKVKEHEALPYDLEWRKNILHLGGGQSEQEITLFKNYLGIYKDRAERPFFGGVVKSIYRQSVRDIVTNINVSRDVNNGLSLMTFFGHSSPTISDIDIGLVSNNINGYRNKGKYPMILMNGCSSGNAFGSYTFGEDWIITPERGAVLFLAHSNLGFANLLHLYSNNFYELAFNDPNFYGKPVGEIQLGVVNKVNAVTTSFFAVNMVAEMLLQGDPAIRLFSPAKPDYAVTDQSLSLQSLDGNPVSASSEHFTVAIDVRNLGKATEDSFYVSVKRILPTNEVIEISSTLLPPVYNRDTLLIQLESAGAASIGINKFEVFVDHTNRVDELNENNNIARIEYFFGRSDLAAVYPPEYSIVSKQKVALKGYASEVREKETDYHFELSTTHDFRNPLQTGVVKANMLPVWEVTLPQNTASSDSTVYYWRFRLKTVEAGKDTVWGSSSFRYIPDSPTGWSQSQYGQFDKAVLKDMKKKAASPTWEFGDTRRTIEIRGAGGSIGFSYPPYGIFVDGSAFFSNNCGYGKPNLLVAVFHQRSLERYTQMPAGSGALCGTDPQSFYHFSDLTSADHRAQLETFLNAVPQGYKVALVSMNQVPFGDFPESLKEAFRQVGSLKINSLANGHPFALVGEKGGQPGTAQELTYNSDDPTAAGSQSIHLIAELAGKLPQGTITSSRIGPASEWGALHHKVRKTGADAYTLNVIGIDQNGQETVLVQDVQPSVYSLQSISAAQYPYMYLSLTASDASDRTPPQLEQWIVTYQGVPEGIIRPDLVGLAKYKEPAPQGGNMLRFPFVFQNISDLDFKEALTAEVTLYRADGTEKVETIPLRPLAAQDTLQFSYSFSSAGTIGENRVRVFVNPRLLPELDYTNNIFEFTFGINRDELHPVLDVVFDGIHIMDGDIVSPSPVITMELKDENKTQFIQDPSLMEVFLKKPGGTDFEVISMVTHAADIQVTPGNNKNPFRLDYHPKNLPDGVYELRVQGKDVAGNLSGKEMYKINFEVINASTITRFYPYPNPFSSNTRFIFTLTGGAVPERMKIQVLTVTGKVVREITHEEIGPIRVGNNITQFAWDGTDEFGDKLANGVYLYRVVMDRNQDEFKHRQTAGDKAFKQEYGKLYILR